MGTPRMLLFILCAASLLLGAATGCDSSEPEPQDAMLVNRTGEDIIHFLHPDGLVGPAGFLPRTITFKRGNAPFQTLKSGASYSLGECDSIKTDADYEGLWIWKIEPSEDDEKKATHQLTLSLEQFVARLRSNDCRIVLDSLS